MAAAAAAPRVRAPAVGALRSPAAAVVAPRVQVPLEYNSLNADRGRLWQRVDLDTPRVCALMRLLMSADGLNELPSHPVLWNRHRCLSLGEESLEWAWLRWFAQRGLLASAEADLAGFSQRAYERLLPTELQLIEDVSVALLAPMAVASESVEQFTTVPGATYRTQLKQALASVWPTLTQRRNLTTLPIPERLRVILGSEVHRAGLTESERARWNQFIHDGFIRVPDDPLATVLYELLMDKGCVDTFVALHYNDKITLVNYLTGRQRPVSVPFSF